MNRQQIKIKFLFILGLSLLYMNTSCASRKPSSEAKSEVSSTAQPHAEHETEPQVKLIPATGHTVAKNTEKKPSAAHDSSSHAEAKGVAPDQALKWLQNGNKRYLKGFLRKDGQKKSDIERLSTGQNPHTIIISCSDSRVPPEIVFDQKLGEIFVIRTAGETLGENALGSIEYAVEHLGTRHIVVLGHTSCGAVKAAIQTLKGQDLGSPNLNKLVADIHPRIRSAASEGNSSKDLAKESWANAKGVAQDLLKRSAIIQTAVEKGHVTIRSAMYHLDSGEVHFE